MPTFVLPKIFNSSVAVSCFGGCNPRYESLRWIVRRKDAFAFLLSDPTFASGSKELSQHELDMIAEIADVNSPDGVKFWATCLTVQCLSDWGVSTSVWFHSCACTHHQSDKEKQQCRLKGRRAVELAAGAWRGLTDSLSGLKLTPAALNEISKLENIGNQDLKSFASRLLHDFQDCRSTMVFRSQQAWSFWDSMPFSLLQMAKHLVPPLVAETLSRAQAESLMLEFDASTNKTSLGMIAWHFFGNDHNRSRLLQWIHGGKLPRDLEQMLLGYATSLCVMQRLEARHHLVNLMLTHGRASSPAATMSNLRRRMNCDVQHPAFQQLLPQLLDRFSELVPEPWDSRKQLLEIVYGYGLSQLHPDTTFEEQRMARHAALTDSLGSVPDAPKLVTWLRFNSVLWVLSFDSDNCYCFCYMLMIMVFCFLLFHMGKTLFANKILGTNSNGAFAAGFQEQQEVRLCYRNLCFTIS